MPRPLVATLMTSALILGACSNGPSAEEEAKDRKAAAAKKTEATNRALGEDLRAAAKTMKTRLNAQKKMDSKVAEAALKAKGYASGTSLFGPADKSYAFCIWATSPKTKRTYVYQSLTDDAKATSEPVDWCVAAEYASPIALTAEDLKRESATDAEMGLKVERDGKALRQNLQRLADTIEKDWTVTPNWTKPTNATEKRLGARKQKMIEKAMKGFEPGNSLLMGGTFAESHFCLVMYYDGGLRQAAVYQHLDKKVVRVKSGTSKCTIGTVPRP
jgi:hypothetical protein